jgi:hypothetical protein
MSDRELRELERSTDPVDHERRRIELIRVGRAAEIGSEWAAQLTRVEKLRVASWNEDALDGPACLPPDVTEEARRLDAILHRIESDAFWPEVAREAIRVARESARLEWGGASAIYQAHAVLGCQRQLTRRALGLKRMPSFAAVKGMDDRVALVVWESACAYKTYGRNHRAIEDKQPSGRDRLADKLRARRAAGVVSRDLLAWSGKAS